MFVTYIHMYVHIFLMFSISVFLVVARVPQGVQQRQTEVPGRTCCILMHIV